MVTVSLPVDTVRVTVQVPALVKVYVNVLRLVLSAPLQVPRKLHVRLSISPVDVSLNETVSGASPELGLAVSGLRLRLM